MDKKISDKVINRLTLYHCILDDYINQNVEFISSKQIAGLLKIDDSQVRKDINLLNNSGKSRVGYIVKELKKSIEVTLGFAKTKNAFIVGAGNLGMALAKYNNFANYGLNIVALFDNDKKKIGGTVNHKVILDISKLPNLSKKSNVDIAILTVPREYAQLMADFLVKADIKHIWNFTPAVLDVPEDVQVWNENLMGNFLQFSYNI
ncbi:TPA: redox-sensing transcriptional repressor Rex [Candidatus Scatousia excrementigallinarum]|uniref:Redox-sensing transcriptional repressor Rex n=1 Tax=Candidatus Scatousia excrementigallinarum TaxID=2840935 RepID=A0A9D1F0N0_9BACT|nr:redox-sensing transcriptional repressor Rex [Candidatus Scatousia excrementigallinarum]